MAGVAIIHGSCLINMTDKPLGSSLCPSLRSRAFGDGRQILLFLMMVLAFSLELKDSQCTDRSLWEQ